MNSSLQPIEPFFHPHQRSGPSPEYQEFMRVRHIILNVIRNDTPEKTKVLNDLVDTLLEYDQDIPTGIISSVLAVAKIGRKVKALDKKRKIYAVVVSSLIEQIFDPGLEFKMTKKDILDAFEANDLEREKITTKQVSQIYVKIIHKLKVGELRDLTYEEQLYRYVQLKLREIQLSRQDWELNGR